MLTRQKTIAAAVVLCLTVATGCGSRADFSVSQGAVDSSGESLVINPDGTVSEKPAGAVDGGADPALGGGDDTTGAAGTSTVPGSPGDPGSSGSPGDPGSPGSGTQGTTTTGAGSNTAGSNMTPIRLSYIVQGTAGASALTGRTVSGDDDAAVQTMKALVAYANANGGVGGRKISATGHKSEATSQQPERLALCKSITEDVKAQVVLDANQFLTEEAWSCFAQHKTAYFGTVTATDRSFLATTAPYVNTTWISLDRGMKATVEGGNAAGYFKSGKVGVILADVPTSRKLADTVLKPALAKIGIHDVTYRYITNDSNGGQQAQTNSAVLAFSNADINRVLFFHNILVYLGFTNQAQSQGYKPNYAFSDYQGMTAVAAFYGSAEQNKDAIGISSSPSFVPEDDSRSTTDTTAPLDRSKVTPGQRRCLDILSDQTKKDYYDPNSSGDTLGTWSYYCDEFFAWWESAKLVGNSWTPQDTGRGLQLLGKSYLSSIQNSTDWSAGVSDGASSYRVGRYNTTCKCFPKVSGWLPI